MIDGLSMVNIVLKMIQRVLLNVLSIDLIQ